jgi:Tfp pilus assembly protein PilE
MTNSEIILALIIVGLSIIMPIYYSYSEKKKRRRVEERLKEAKYVSEKEKIRVYLDNINETTRAKHR